MTQENRERLYAHYRDLQNNYEAPENLNRGMTSTGAIKTKAKFQADKMLIKNPELKELNSKEETPKVNGNAKKSKG